MKEICICIHGHFYQPPRENAWIEDVEFQESARPYHDWNERILHECYLPNTRARVLGHDGMIEDIVNNFEKISFNFGPTLMSWLEHHEPDTYRRIIEADKASAAEHNGHGNAIAQVYNHMIMPLANRRDKKTQTRWGLEEFRFRYGRDAESIWLSETACNEETLEVLVEEGVKFIILEPHQAEAFRPLGGEKPEWKDVSRGQIDPKRPYRCFLRKDPSRYIDIFFYDGPISKSVGFENLLQDAKIFMDRIQGAIIDYGDTPQLIHIATDGETYGHHKAFGDRVLAYLLNVNVPEKNFRIVNYGEFLEANPPAFEVRLKEGENGEGTSWSCAHGVKRWRDHCGCRGGGPPEWTQHWRKPLRESLDWLRDELAALYEKMGSVYLKDVWEARDDYIRVILDRSPENIAGFFARHAVRLLSPEEVTLCLKLLEMQRHAMLMYTSCGWFFTELSGIETIQVLQYAARAIQLAYEVDGNHHEANFLERLSHAKSNVETYRDGRTVYEKLVKTSVSTLERVVGFYAMGSMFEDYYPATRELDLYCYHLKIFYQRLESFGNVSLNFGRVRVQSRLTLEEKDLIFIVAEVGVYDFRCTVKPYTDDETFEELERRMFEELHESNIVEIFKKIDALFGEKYVALKDLLIDDRMGIISRLTKKQIDAISRFYERVYDESRRINEIYGSIHLPIPMEFRYTAEHVLGKRLMAELRKLAEIGFPLRKAHTAYRMIEAAKSFQVEIDKVPPAKFLSEEIESRIRAFMREPKEDPVLQCINISKISEKIGVTLDMRRAQDDLFFLVNGWMENPHTMPASVAPFLQQVFLLMNRLQLGVQKARKILGKPAGV